MQLKEWTRKLAILIQYNNCPSEQQCRRNDLENQKKKIELKHADAWPPLLISMYCPMPMTTPEKD
jgi:hypothetical protein